MFRTVLNPFSCLVISVAGWMNQRQQDVIEYLVEETVFSASNWEVAAFDSRIARGDDSPPKLNGSAGGFSIRSPLSSLPRHC
jgi:hypothetical protein